MAKIKERKSESWKPSLNHDDGFISKNKKRKDKRMSLNLAAKKIDTEEFIPIKKSLLALNKSKDTLKSTPNKFLSPALDRKQTPKKKDTPMPALEGKKIFPVTPVPAAKAFKKNDTPKMKIEPAGTPKLKKEPASTPKLKTESAATPKSNIQPIIKSSLKKKAQKFIDNEAEEGEEPISDKVVKPYVKGLKRKSISFKMDNDNEDSESDDDDDSLSDDSSDAPALVKGTGSEFIDSEASEGEETSDDDDDDDDDDDLYGSSLDDEDLDESIDTDDDLGSDDDDEDDDDESDEEDSEDDDENQQQQLKHKQNKPKATSPVKNKKIKVEENDDEDEEEELPKSKKAADETKLKSKPVPPVPAQKVKVEKSQKINETQVKKSKPLENGILKVNEQSKTATDKKSSDYAGYIKFLSNSVTEDQLKAHLISVVGVKNLVSVAPTKSKSAKSNNWLVYVSNEDSLNALENKTFTIGKVNFKIYKARESKKLVKSKLLVFLPRVPLSVENEKIKSIIESDTGAGKILSLKSKKVNDRLKTRNVLIELADEETLKKVIYKGSYSCNGSDLVVRQAYESGSQIPIYKIVFSGIPEQANEALVKKAVENKVGSGTVMTVKFSFRKKSFAFVTLSNEQAQKKLLEPGIEISVKGTKLQVLEFKPRVPKKRGPSKKKDAQAPAAKKQKTDNQKSEQSPSQPKSKKRKNKNKPAIKSETQSNSPVKSEPKSQQQQSKIKSEPQSASPNKPQQKAQQQNKKKQPLKPAQNNVQNSPKKQKSQQQPASTSPSSPSKNKKAKKAQNQVPDKKANLNNKLETKKNKLKDKKMKKKQAGASE